VTKTADTVLVLRTCAADMTSYEGFRWPESGPVEAKDWNAKPECGHGLHGLLWGEGDGGLLAFARDARWLVVEVPAGSTIDLAGKVKFPRGVVVHRGDRKSATDYLRERAPGRAIVGGTATAGDGGTATAGYRGTATAGDGGILNLRWWGGKRYRIATFYVGEDGIEPNTPYRCDQNGKPVKVDKPAQEGSHG